MSEDILTYTVHGMKIVDFGYRKPVYKTILDKYFHYMEKYIYIGPDESKKKESAWDWVFNQEDIKNLDMKGLTKEQFKKLFDTDGETKVVKPEDDPNYEDDDSEDEVE